MKNLHAVALGKLGGEARAAKMTPDERKQWARLGGLARAERHTKEELSRWAKMGGRPPKRAPINRMVRVSSGSEQTEGSEQPSHMVSPEVESGESETASDPTRG